MSGRRRSTTQQSNGDLCSSLQGVGAGADGDDLHVVVREQFDDTLALDVVVFDDEKPFRMRCDVGLDAIERMFQILRRRRFHQIRKRSMRQSVLALLFDGEHLHRNMAGCRIQLQIVENRPAEHIRQEHIERDGRRLILSRQAQRRLAAMRDDSLESFVAGHSEQNSRVVRIVIDDEQDIVSLDECHCDHRERLHPTSAITGSAGCGASALYGFVAGG